MIRQLPMYEYKEYFTKCSDIALLIPTWNEGKRIQTELNRIEKENISLQVDIFLLDGGTTDGSLDEDFLSTIRVRGVFTIREKGQGTAYRVGFAKVIDDAYRYCITVDGNNKDSVEQILKSGVDFVQGSCFIQGGYHENTPKARVLAIKYFSNPLLSLVAGIKYTDTMSAFRGFNADILQDKRLNIFRNIFQTWELQWYLASRIPRLGYKVQESP